MVKKILITLGIIMVVMVVGLGVLLAIATESQPPRNISVYQLIYIDIIVAER